MLLTLQRDLRAFWGFARALFCSGLFIRPRMKKSPTQALYYVTEIQLKGREKRTYAPEIPMQMSLPGTAAAVSQDAETGSQVSW